MISYPIPVSRSRSYGHARIDLDVWPCLPFQTAAGNIALQATKGSARLMRDTTTTVPGASSGGPGASRLYWIGTASVPCSFSNLVTRKEDYRPCKCRSSRAFVQPGGLAARPPTCFPDTHTPCCLGINHIPGSMEMPINRAGIMASTSASFPRMVIGS